MSKIKLIIGSTRQNRVGVHVADWLVKTAKEADIELEVLDLQKIALPNFDAAIPPSYVPTQTEEGKAWQASIAEADGFVFLTPEYNRSIPASLKNAIDYLVDEWKDKSAAIVSYGYVDGGKSATSHLQDIISWLKINNLGDEMAVSFNRETLDESGAFNDADETFADIKEPFIEALHAITKTESLVAA